MEYNFGHDIDHCHGCVHMPMAMCKYHWHWLNNQAGMFKDDAALDKDYTSMAKYQIFMVTNQASLAKKKQASEHAIKQLCTWPFKNALGYDDGHCVQK
jgi:hypothetical protein